MLLSSPRSLYAAFDRFPTRKGASTHIARFAPCLFEHAGGGLLYVLGDATLPVHQREGELETVRFSRPIANFLERALGYGHYLEQLLGEAQSSLSIAHFRDPWGGVPILARAGRYSSVYEVNALPSIELPHSFPAIAPRTLEKIRASELFCLDRCDAIVTPSQTTRALLLSLGVSPDKVRVIPNGADCLSERGPHPMLVDRTLDEPAMVPEAPTPYLIYFGALQSWQGIDTMLRAFSRLADLSDLRLVICAAHPSRDARRAQRFATKLGIAERIVWRWALSAAELSPWIAHAELSLAPLRECARNVTQGCAPLKILESMAAGVPVVSSDLAPVRELIRDGVEGRLVAPDRPAELARAIRVLLAYPEQRKAMGERGRERVARDFSWQNASEQLRSVYRAIAPAHQPHRENSTDTSPGSST